MVTVNFGSIIGECQKSIRERDGISTKMAQLLCPNRFNEERRRELSRVAAHCRNADFFRNVRRTVLDLIRRGKVDGIDDQKF